MQKCHRNEVTVQSQPPKWGKNSCRKMKPEKLCLLSILRQLNLFFRNDPLPGLKLFFFLSGFFAGFFHILIHFFPL